MKKPSREAVVAEALTWQRTPYHHRASIKGAGVDCAMILVEVYFAVGLVAEKPVIEDYPPDFMLHRDDERYLGWLKKYGQETSYVRPGDVIAWKFGRCFSHGAIAIDKTTIIHAYRKAGMVTLDSVDSTDFSDRECKIFTFWDD